MPFFLDAVKDALGADAVLPTLLSDWDFGDGEEPAIFTVDPAPLGVGSPFVVLTQDGGVVNDTRGSRGTEIEIDARVFGDKTESSQGLQQAAWRVWSILHRGSLEAPAGFCVVNLWASPPAGFTDPDGFPGYSIRCSLLASEIGG